MTLCKHCRRTTVPPARTHFCGAFCQREYERAAALGKVPWIDEVDRDRKTGKPRRRRQK